MLLLNELRRESKKKNKAWFILEQLIIKIKTVVYLLSLIGGIFIHKHGQLFVKQ